MNSALSGVAAIFKRAIGLPLCSNTHRSLSAAPHQAASAAQPAQHAHTALVGGTTPVVGLP